MAHDGLVQLLLSAPDSQIDTSIKRLIERWSDPPKALEILEALDGCVHAAAASGFATSVLEALYAGALKREGTRHEDVVALATWRNGEPGGATP